MPRIAKVTQPRCRSVQSCGLQLPARASKAHRNTTSALWNSGIDLGASLGGTLLGLAASGYGYSTAIWVMPAVVLIAVPLVLLPAKPMATPDGEEPAENLAEPERALSAD